MTRTHARAREADDDDWLMMMILPLSHASAHTHASARIMRERRCAAMMMFGVRFVLLVEAAMLASCGVWRVACGSVLLL